MNTSVDAGRYQSAAKVAAQQEARAHDRFVTYHNADGRLIRQRVDPVAADEHQKSLEKQKRYQQIVAAAAQQARSRQYMKTMTAIPANCCSLLLKSAAPLAAGGRRVLHFDKGDYGWINMRVPHPAMAFALQDQVAALVVKTFKEGGKYLSPYVLFLNAQGTPLLAINNLFQRRYKETWYRYGYLQGRIRPPKKAAYVVFYLPYESGGGRNKMMRVPAPTLVPEEDATPADEGELMVSTLPALTDVRHNNDKK